MSEVILIADDEKEIADLVALYLENEGFRIVKCYDGAMAMEMVENERLDLAILDIMPVSYKHLTLPTTPYV